MVWTGTKHFEKYVKNNIAMIFKCEIVFIFRTMNEERLGCHPEGPNLLNFANCDWCP